MPKTAPKTSASKLENFPAAALASSESFAVPTAFAAGAAGREAALALGAQALAAMAELHLAAACDEIAEWFTENPDVVGFMLSRDGEGDDEGRYWTSERFFVDFKDGTDSGEYHDDEDAEGALSDSRDNLKGNADSFFAQTLDLYPLARKDLLEKKLTAHGVRSLVPRAFKARQEALAISSVSAPAPRSKRLAAI